MRFFYCLFFLAALQLHAFPQAVGVNHSTGAAQVSIPITSVSIGSLSLGVSLNYYSTGIKVKELENNAGMGWQLSAGGAITRELRGFPDDQSSGSIQGWLLNSSGTYANGFTIANDNNYATCSDGATDLSYLSTYFPNHTDTEPDIFYVNAPGINCRLVLDADHNFRPIPYQDIKVSYHIDTYNNLIDKFTIVNDKGITYTFDVIEMTNKQTVSSSPSSINVFKTAYEQFQGSVSYVKKWHLTKIQDLNGNQIELSYQSEGVTKRSSSPVMVVQPGASSSSLLYNINESYAPKLLTWIFANNISIDPTAGSVRFDYTTSSNNITLLDSIRTKGQVYKFDYINAKSLSGGTPVYGRYFLSRLYSGINSPFDYKFTYQGVDTLNVLGPLTTLPDSTSIAIDYWGYYNGSSATSLVPEIKISPYGLDEVNGRYHFNVTGFSNSNYNVTLSGVARNASASYATAGSLKTISNALGGTTTIDYELNSYRDLVANTTVKGAGIRVSKLTESDLGGIRSVRNFDYEDPNTFHRPSGKPITIPSFAFPTVYSGSGSPTHANSTIRGEDDLSNEDTGVIYQYVRESNASGSILYEFTVPATNYDTSVSPDWALTTSYSNMPTCATTGYLNNLTRSYPYAPNPNFEFERGLPLKTTAYNTVGERVSETLYEYARTGSPEIINAIRIDENAGAIVYAKYSMLANVDELLTKKTTTTYEPGTQAQLEQQVVDYYYQGTDHKLLTQSKTTNSDGSIARTYTKYIRDYNYAGGVSDDNSTALLALKNLNVNVPVESYSQLEKSSVNRTISASLTKFKKFSSIYSDRYLPAQQLGLLAANGLTDFQVSSISSGNFANDSRYNILSNQLSYSILGIPLSSDNNRHQVRSVIANIDTSLPVTFINNATTDEVLVNTFEYTSETSLFNPSSSIILTNDNHTGTYGLELGTSAVFTGTLKKGAHVKYYVFSAWIKATGSGTLQLTLTNSSSTSYNYPISFANTSGNYKKYEIRVPVDNMSTDFEAKFITSASIKIDDVLFYPALADISMISYDFSTHLKIDETNSAGIVTYYQYDSYNRPTLVLDQDRNIVKRFTYNLASSNSGIYYSEAQSATYTKNDCSSGTGSPVLYMIPAGAYSSTVSQSDANSLASSALSAKGQAYANAKGSCGSSHTHIVYTNDTQVIDGATSGGISKMVVKSSTGTILYTFTEAEMVAGIAIPQGSYTIEFTTYGNYPLVGTSYGWATILFYDPGYALYQSIEHSSNWITTYTLTGVNLNQSDYSLSVSQFIEL